MNKLHLLKTIAIIPVYHDKNITRVLTKFKRKAVDEICVIIDDPSINDISTICGSDVSVPVHIIENEVRRGIGYAIKQGIRYAIDKKYNVVVILAGNGKDDPAEVPRLLEPIVQKDYDYVQGSRFLPGGRRINNPFLRGIFSRLFPYIWTLLTGVRCTDVTNGFRAYKLNLLKDKRINLWQNWLDAYELEYYIHYKVLTLHYKMKEVPVSKTYSHRNKGGYTKISPFRDWWKIVGPLICLRMGIRK